MRITEIVKNNPERMSQVIAERKMSGWRFIEGESNSDYLLCYTAPTMLYLLDRVNRSIHFIELDNVIPTEDRMFVEK